MKTFIRVIAWELLGVNFKVFFYEWDGKCLCTCQKLDGTINSDFTEDPENVSKKEIHEQILKQIFKK